MIVVLLLPVASVPSISRPRIPHPPPHSLTGLGPLDRLTNPCHSQLLYTWLVHILILVLTPVLTPVQVTAVEALLGVVSILLNFLPRTRATNRRRYHCCSQRYHFLLILLFHYHLHQPTLRRRRCRRGHRCHTHNSHRRQAARRLRRLPTTTRLTKVITSRSYLIQASRLVIPHPCRRYHTLYSPQ